MNPRLMGIWVYFILFQQAKEILSIFFILTFIGSPAIQIVPCLILTLISLLVVIIKKPLSRLRDNILAIV